MSQMEAISHRGEEACSLKIKRHKSSKRCYHLGKKRKWSPVVRLERSWQVRTTGCLKPKAKRTKKNLMEKDGSFKDLPISDPHLN